MPGFYRHIDYANNADMTNFLPYIWQGQRIGWIKKSKLDLLSDYSEAFEIKSDQVCLSPKEDSYQGRTIVLRE